jgi:hypothetical protein
MEEQFSEFKANNEPLYHTQHMQLSYMYNNFGNFFIVFVNEYYAMKTYKGVDDIAPNIHNLSTRWR